MITDVNGGVLMKITDSEWEVMDILWNSEESLSTKDIMGKLEHDKWSLATVKTLVNRLLKKGAIDYKSEGKAYMYYPLIKKTMAVREEKKGFLEKVFKGSEKDMILNMVKESTLSEDEIDELRNLLDKKREQ